MVQGHHIHSIYKTADTTKCAVDVKKWRPFSSVSGEMDLLLLEVRKASQRIKLKCIKILMQKVHSSYSVYNKEIFLKVFIEATLVKVTIHQCVYINTE